MNMRSLLALAMVGFGGFGGLVHAQEAVAVAPAEQGPWKANAGINAVINTGNAENQTVGGNSLLLWKESQNQVQWTMLGAYGRATVGGVSQTNTKNFKTELRYDRYVSDPISIFVLGNIGFDTPAGLDLKTGAALGYAHRLILGPPHTLRYELGPDYTREERTDGSKDDIFSGRGFIGYLYEFSKDVSFSEEFTVLSNFEETSDVRLNSLTAIKAKMTDIIAFQVGFNLRTDFEPVPGFEEVDTTTTVGLLFDLI